MKLPLATAQKYAAQIVAELTPYCVPGRIQVAGSIRRERPICNDIDLVVIPLPGQWPSLKERCLRRGHAIVKGEEVFAFELPNGVQVDIFRARLPDRDLTAAIPGTWGTVLLCRTGSKEHNIYLCQEAKNLGLRWSPPDGVLNEHGEVIAGETEESIFRALQMVPIGPAQRERTP